VTHWIDFREPVTTEMAMTLREFHFRLTVYVDGDDVTNDCVEAFAGQDYVVLLATDAQGHHYVDHDDPDRGPAKRTRIGKVTFALDPL
jgi:hypothetical protein